MRGVMQKRYPGLQFLIQVSEKANLKEFSEYGYDISDQVAQNLEGIEVVYVYGLGMGYHYDTLRSWLDDKAERELVFLEDEMGAIEALEKEGKFDQIFSHPKVHLIPMMPGAEIEQFCLEVARQFPSSKVKIMALNGYKETKKERFELIVEGLYRAVSIISAMQLETLYHHQLFKNLIVNYARVPDAFLVNALAGRFKGVPAIICGAGPSLQESIPEIQKLEDRAMIFAGGSTIAALTHHGIQPHIAAAVDPNPSEFNCLKLNSLQNTPLVYANRVLPKIFSTFSGPLGYVRTGTGGLSEHLMEERLKLSGPSIEEVSDPNGMSVTTLCISIASAMGCDPIILTGVDLAYTGEKRYSEGVMEGDGEVEMNHNSFDRVFYRKGVRGEKVRTLTKWLMESDWISAKAKREKGRFINATSDGLGFKGIPNESLSDVAKTYLSSQYPIREWLHAEIESVKIGSEKKEPLDALLNELYQSLEKMDAILEAIGKNLKEHKRLDHPILVVLELDLKEEFAYQKLMANILPAVLSTVTKTMNRIPLDATLKEQTQYAVKVSDKKYRFMQKIVHEYIETFKLEFLKDGS